jgi:hypothetical protein
MGTSVSPCPRPRCTAATWKLEAKFESGPSYTLASSAETKRGRSTRGEAAAPHLGGLALRVVEVGGHRDVAALVEIVSKKTAKLKGVYRIFVSSVEVHALSTWSSQGQPAPPYGDHHAPGAHTSPLLRSTRAVSVTESTHRVPRNVLMVYK